MAKRDQRVIDHLEWIGFVRPTGLVVSAPALVKAGVILNRRDIAGQKLLREWVESGVPDPAGTTTELPDFRQFAEKVLGWRFSPKGYAGTPEVPIPADLELPLPESGEAFRPDFAVRSEPLRATAPPAVPEGDELAEEPSPWQLLVSVCEPGSDLDRAITGGGLDLSPHGRMERLLRNTGVPAGLLFNGETIRLVSAPRGESSGWLDFQVRDMVQTAGRPICSAMRELLGETRLLSVARSKRLAALLEDSRKFQNEVSERLAEQVLHALYELLRGFQAAHDASNGRLLGQWLADDPDEIYRGLLTVVLRLVYLLYAEERDMLPQDETFLGAYSVSGLYERLRADASVHPDTMDQRYGAYAQLLALWRMVHDGARGPQMAMAPKRGDLFQPDRYPFLEGGLGTWQTLERIEPPRVADGTIHRVLEKLIVLDGERISYRALDVEHIGSVYETMMGFRLERATGRSVAIKAAKKHGAPATLNLETLLSVPIASRVKWIRGRTDRKLSRKVGRSVREADTLEVMHAALDSVIDRNATPDIVPAEAMVLQPSEERRRSGSHYTPRGLTEPIVRIALEPILVCLSEKASGSVHPEQILDLKVCDPAMGSGAFLVEACRQLADALIEAWRAHDAIPEIPPDENEEIYARRLVAQRCLYGVDRNPKAVDLAKLSLWLITLAKDHPLTFLDHALRHGDSLVGLSIPQLRAFHWKGNAPNFTAGVEALRGQKHLERAAELRRRIGEADDQVSDWERRDWLHDAEKETDAVRSLGDLVLAAFFHGSKVKQREARRKFFADQMLVGQAKKDWAWLTELRNSDPPLAPFHWEIEFPEVFDRANPGFDTIVGNPPFLGGRNLTATQGAVYTSWLRTIHTGSSGGADLVAHFFRRAYDLIRIGGNFGLIATTTIAQGDTRASGLRWICTNGGEIFSATRRIKWPGHAAVLVSVVHVTRGRFNGSRFLDQRPVATITSYLYHRGTDEDPQRLYQNQNQSYQGTVVLGMGFTFDDTDTAGIASPITTMARIQTAHPASEQIIQPYIGGKELNFSPTQAHHRYVINFGEHSEATCRRTWPELFEIVEEKVKPNRINKDATKYPRMVHEWWKYWNPRYQLYNEIRSSDRVLANARVSKWVQFTFLPTNMIYSDKIIVYPLDTQSAFCALQSRLHDIWARFFSSTRGDGLNYTPSDCFETFPFPENWETRSDLETVGETYYELRAALMVRNNEGLTKTYNRFHDPYENDPEIAELRRLHTAMDQAVLDAYGWTDIPTDCEFLLDYEIDEKTWGKKKKPYRYRWPDAVRDEVLARLLELNAKRAAEEARTGLTRSTTRAGKARLPPSGGRRAPSTGTALSATLWDEAP
ncbi:MAG: N-6 DNA methylase [bacterium]|nr:N-6 DNA methylase [bacterium]